MKLLGLSVTLLLPQLRAAAILKLVGLEVTNVNDPTLRSRLSANQFQGNANIGS